MDILEDLNRARPPSATLPLLGHTVLLVEDSRFACEAVRLMCLKSGARIRRADSLFHARQHLRVYRPSVVIVDLGLPDGSGDELIEELDRARPRVDVLLATSADRFGEDRAIAAGADGFLSKPIAQLAEFQIAILDHLPIDRRPKGPRPLSNEVVAPDPIALRDDLALVADVLLDVTSDGEIDYLTQFVGSIAASTQDHALTNLVADLSEARHTRRPIAPPLSRLAAEVQMRLRATAPI